MHREKRRAAKWSLQNRELITRRPLRGSAPPELRLTEATLLPPPALHLPPWGQPPLGQLPTVLSQFPLKSREKGNFQRMQTRVPVQLAHSRHLTNTQLIQALRVPSAVPRRGCPGVRLAGHCPHTVGTTEHSCLTS